jgi:uncharacterized Zn finger protein
MVMRETTHSGDHERTRQQLLGEKWWTSEFLSMMRPGKDTSQLVKGRKMAERGQVIIQTLYAGGIDTIVLGAVGGSHRVSIWIADLDDDWEVVYRIFAENDLQFSHLLSGIFDPDLNSLLQEVNIHIIPKSIEDLDYRCDCESDHHTCSHIVATYMALGSLVNENPLAMFLLRGKTKEEIIEGVCQYTTPQIEPEEEIPFPVDGEEPHEIDSEDLSRFYDPGPGFEKIQIRDACKPGKETDIITTLGPSPFKLGKRDLTDYIINMYQESAKYVHDLKKEPERILPSSHRE